MDFELTPEQQQFRLEVQEVIRRTATPEAVDESLHLRGGQEQVIGPEGRKFLKRLGEQGFRGIGWPKEYGGQGRSTIDQWILSEELTYVDLPIGGLSVTSVGPAIAKMGTEEQKQKYLSGILRGEIFFAVGYSEPNAGTDLASLETRAVRDGDHYVVNGQKIYTTGAEYATHLWLACRTDPNATPKHRGISVLLVPMNSPGITVRPLWPLAGGRTNEVFLDNVRVPVSERVGEENRGWRAIMTALDFERIFPYSGLLRQFEYLVEYANKTEIDGQKLIHDRQVRHTLARLAAELEVARLFCMRTAWLIDQGTVPTAEASMNKVWLTELRERLSNIGIELLGPRGILRWEDPQALMDGSMVNTHLYYPVQKFAMGTNEAQRNIIAQRGLGLPRA